jgi:Asp-tRNA(Asn)/Glu-tRNA(Gln) amidotransferase A subunit family amidase
MYDWRRLHAQLTISDPFHAWVEINPQAPLGEGPLNGIPFGVKDIIETAGLATEYGSPLYAGRKGTRDAEIVTRLRRAGGIMYGKTRTTAFAYFDPAETRNPRNPEHTPGGSSSGSAAAVALGFVSFALGTQTMGSIVRPASFCGVTGFKPTFATLPTDGVLPFAPSLDTVGLLADSPATVALVWRALGFQVADSAAVRYGIPKGLPAVSDEMASGFKSAAQRLSAEPLEMPLPYADLLQAARIINDYEGARSHYERWQQFGDRIGVKLAELVARGMQIPEEHYQSKRRLLRDAAEQMNEAFDEFPVLITPATLGAAPFGLASTGDPAMNAVWTALGTPAIGIPMPVPGLPLGLQMIARGGADNILIRSAIQVEAELKR